MYFLMNKNTVIGTFEKEGTGLAEEYVFEPIEKNLLPIGFQDIEKWLSNRHASKHNSHLRELMRDCGCDTAEGFIKVTHAASITDTFWVKSDAENVKWEDVSFYRNPFDITVSRLAFEGLGLYGLEPSSTSPELTTDGSFPKCWKKEDNGIFLYKRGSSGARNAGLEPYGEVMASELAVKLIPDNSVKYDLVHFRGKIASRCKLFTNEDFGYVPSSRFPINSSSVSQLFRFYENVGSEDDFRRMLVLDAITFNIDRHAGNHGMLVNNDTQVPVKMAPVFDLNLAMLPYVEQDEFEHIGDKLLQYGPRIGGDFTRMGQVALTSSIRSDLIALKGFSFSFRGDEKFPEWRVKTLEKIVNHQIDAVLKKDVLYTKDVFIPSPRKKEVQQENPGQDWNNEDWDDHDDFDWTDRR